MSLVQRTFSYAVLSCLITALSHNKCCLFLKQGFLTSVKGWGDFCIGGEWEILLQRYIFIGWWEPKKERFWLFEPFSKLKTTFCKYWTLIKIKISMTRVYKEHEVKVKIVQKQCFHCVITWKSLFSGRIESLIGG